MNMSHDETRRLALAMTTRAEKMGLQSKAAICEKAGISAPTYEKIMRGEPVAEPTKRRIMTNLAISQTMLEPIPMPAPAPKPERPPKFPVSESSTLLSTPKETPKPKVEPLPKPEKPKERFTDMQAGMEALKQKLEPCSPEPEPPTPVPEAQCAPETVKSVVQEIATETATKVMVDLEDNIVLPSDLNFEDRPKFLLDRALSYGERTMLFVDGANISAATSYAGIKVRYEWLLNYLAQKTKFVRAQYYTGLDYDARTGQLRNETFYDWLKRVGYVLVSDAVTESRLRNSHETVKKGNMDMQLAMDVCDAVDDAAINHVILMSGDSDFAPMVRRIQRRGARVTVISMGLGYNATSRKLIDVADLFVPLNTFYEAIVEREQR